MDTPRLRAPQVSSAPVPAVHSTGGDARPVPGGPAGSRSGLDLLKQGLGGVVAVGGFGLGGFGVLGVIVGVVQVFAPEPEKTRSAGVGITLMAVVFAFAGRFLWNKGLAPYRNARRREQLFGLLRARTRVRVGDVADHMKVSEQEAQALLDTLIARHEVDLVYLPEERQYVHRGALEQGQSVVGRCPSCDAPVGASGVLPGERVLCSYCDAPVVVA